MADVLQVLGADQDISSHIDVTARVQYDGPPVNLLQRWELYKAADEPFDYYRYAYQGLQLEPHDTILDVGCGGGGQLLDLRTDPEYAAFQGTIIGLDISTSASFVTRHEVEKKELAPIQFVLGSMASIPVATGSVQKTIANFSLYHAPNPLAALAEVQRVTETGGLIAVSTNNPGNLPVHRRFEARIAAHPAVVKHFGTRLQGPPTFSRRFHATAARKTFAAQKGFENIDEYEQRAAFTISRDLSDAEREQRLQVYLGSLESKRTSYILPAAIGRPAELVSIPGNIWTSVLDEVVVEPILKQVTTKSGRFVDPIRRTGWILRNLGNLS